MKKSTATLIILSSCLSCFSQYRYDNVLFRTVYPQDLCTELKKQPGYLLLDVRSPGEFADTSSSGLNIGRFRGAKNINVNELGKRITEISAYRNRPVFVYCSHSQRSRRASKLLADSGFRNVMNINGGMTAIRQLPSNGNKCLFDHLETKNKYRLISASDLCSELSDHPGDVFLLDVRDDSAYLHISRDAKTNAYGTFKSAIHISLAEIEKKYPAVPKSKKVIIIDLYGQDAVTAAAFLKKKRYPDVSVLTEGIDRMLGDDQQALGCMGTEYISPVPYSIINTRSLKSFLETSKGYLFLDVRSAEEFTNRHRNSWQNIGHIANAVNIPADGLKDQWKSIEAYKNKRIIIYGFGTSPLAFKAAVDLSKLGFTELYVLHGGLFNIGWTAANVKGYSSLADLREEVPAENQ